MAWEKDWLRWTHVTYGLLQSVCLAESIDFGNLSKLQKNIERAQRWFPSELRFASIADRRNMSAGSIHLKAEDSEQLLNVVRPSVLQMILLTTVSIAESILCEQLVLIEPGSLRPASLRQALDLLSKKLKDNGRQTRNGWAIQAMHEARILRNCIAHGSGVWSEEAVKQYEEQFNDASIRPRVGQSFSISVDDVFAYRRAAKTVLNEAARLLPTRIASRMDKKCRPRTRKLKS
jgi:hypothetical protein